jgi:hypothetical protein
MSVLLMVLHQVSKLFLEEFFKEGASGVWLAQKLWHSLWHQL